MRHEIYGDIFEVQLPCWEQKQCIWIPSMKQRGHSLCWWIDVQLLTPDLIAHCTSWTTLAGFQTENVLPCCYTYVSSERTDATNNVPMHPCSCLVWEVLLCSPLLQRVGYFYQDQRERREWSYWNPALVELALYSPVAASQWSRGDSAGPEGF